ncbi:ABC transporter ATP-binding protein [Listeria grandensis]|uniref:ABC transporter ATP-binding protein n=1 Tax=Listeria grandensis TaxID=1494963 RepID=A0A7X0Y0J6_9LIST|nr:ABC transporter ATP-binding protein [Listeria grandensis]MBC1473772.1 ABC transporter ATP-binding protein [Listeria grandensis]MBC1934738.1 ABC transporter ATP-binding protein [Listeria grandensis]
METILTATDLNKEYGDKNTRFKALDNVNVTVQEGEFIGIMGPSGAGKSTLLNALATIDLPTSGHVKINGTEVLTMSEKQLSQFRREKLGFIFQDYNLLDTLKISENIALPLTISKVSAIEITARVEEVADFFGIHDLLDKFPNQVSGGQKQRAAIARAIITKPDLIFADEPTGALDSKNAQSILQCLQDLNHKENATIMMVTHDAQAASFSKRILFIKDGVVSHELMRGSKTQHHFFKEILATMESFGEETSDVI